MHCGHSQAVVANLNHSPGRRISSLPAHADFYISAWLGVANGIANNIFEGAAKLLRYTRGRAGIPGSHADRAVSSLGFKISIRRDFLEQVCQLYLFFLARFGVAIESRQCEELADQFVQILRFKLNAVQIFRSVFRGTLPQQTQRKGQTSQGRTQLMGNISQQATLCFNKRFDSVCHSVEASSESANFIAPPQNEIVAARSKLAVRDSSCHVTEPGHRSSDAPSKHPTKDSPDEQNHKEA